jgi:pyruvate,water dikinase
VQKLPAGPARDAIIAFLGRFGHRGIREAELIEPRWREDPTLIFDAIRLHLRALPDGVASAIARGKALRAEGERALRELGLPSRVAVLALLRVVRNAMRQRERLRDHVVQVLDLLRLLSVDASRRMAIREPEIGTDAAFFLTLPELHSFLRGELRTVRPLVDMRRAGYERDRTLPDPPDTFVDYPPPAVALSSSRDVLEGLPASSGQVQGRARVLTSTREISGLEPGEILIVPAADVGWSPLFLAAGGLATDLGGPLSHACVVAREYGIPAVVNLRDATRTVNTGDRVLLDGDAGRLQVLHD